MLRELLMTAPPEEIPEGLLEEITLAVSAQRMDAQDKPDPVDPDINTHEPIRFFVQPWQDWVGYGVVLCILCPEPLAPPKHGAVSKPYDMHSAPCIKPLVGHAPKTQKAKIRDCAAYRACGAKGAEGGAGYIDHPGANSLSCGCSVGRVDYATVFSIARQPNRLRGIWLDTGWLGLWRFAGKSPTRQGSETLCLGCARAQI